MSYYAVTTIIDANTERVPHESTIEDAFRLARVHRSEDDRVVGNWVGPHARVTRFGSLGPGIIAMLPFPAAIVGRPFRTAATWIYEVPDYYSASSRARTAEAARGFVQRNLQSIAPRWYNVIRGSHQINTFVHDYSPAVNGPLDWWQSGQASVTSTRSEFPIATLDPNENPVGPTTSGTHPTSLIDSVGQGTQDFTKLLYAVLWVVIPISLASIAISFALKRKGREGLSGRTREEEWNAPRAALPAGATP